MCQFVETICIKDGTARHLHYHVERMQRTIRHFFPHMPMVAESDLLCDVPTIEGLQKARVVYDEHGIIERTFAPYSIRSIKNIIVVEDNNISYPWKSTNRSMLVKQREKAPSYDEVIIVKDGYITDTNIVLQNGIKVGMSKEEVFSKFFNTYPRAYLANINVLRVSSGANEISEIYTFRGKKLKSIGFVTRYKYY